MLRRPRSRPCTGTVAKKAKLHDRTDYTGRVPKNFVPHHAQRASLAVVKGEGEIVDAIASRLKADCAFAAQSGGGWWLAGSGGPVPSVR